MSSSGTGIGFGAGFTGGSSSSTGGTGTATPPGSAGAPPLSFSFAPAALAPTAFDPARARTNTLFIETINAGTNTRHDQSQNLDESQLTELEFYQNQVSQTVSNMHLQKDGSGNPIPGSCRVASHIPTHGGGLIPMGIGFNHTTRILYFVNNQNGRVEAIKFADLENDPALGPQFKAQMAQLQAAVKKHCPMRSMDSYAPSTMKGNQRGSAALQRNCRSLQKLPTSFNDAAQKAIALPLPAGMDPNKFKASTATPLAGGPDIYADQCAKKMACAEAFYTGVMAGINSRINGVMMAHGNQPPAPSHADYADYQKWKKCQEQFAHLDAFAVCTALRFLPVNPMDLMEAAHAARQAVSTLPSKDEEQLGHAEYATDVGGLLFATNSDLTYASQDYYTYSSMCSQQIGKGAKRDSLEDSLMHLTEVLPTRMSDPDATKHVVDDLFIDFINAQDATIRDELKGIMNLAATTTANSWGHSQAPLLPAVATPQLDQARWEAAAEEFGTGIVGSAPRTPENQPKLPPPEPTRWESVKASVSNVFKRSAP
ncbi:MAG: hypothetical protein V4492_00110 [Chlamydiota bacterium]